MAKALLLIDVQNDYFSGGALPLAGMEEASGIAAQLLEQFRNAGLPIVHVRHVFADASAGFFCPDTTGIEIHDSVVPLPEELVITKQQVNAFHQTDLQEQLSSMGVDELDICGAMSHMCVEGSTRAAADLGFRCRVIHDACATCDQKFNGQVVPAEHVHATAMSALGFAYAKVLSIKEWQLDA